MLGLTWAQVLARRLDRHALTTPSGGTAADVVAAICGAHAQVMSVAELSVALRLSGATRVDVRKALWTERSLVKTHGPGGRCTYCRRGTCRCGSVGPPRSRGSAARSPPASGSIPSRPPRWADELFASLEGSVEPVEVDRASACQVAGDPVAADARPAGLRLLPYFDAYAVGSHRGSWCFPAAPRERAPWCPPGRPATSPCSWSTG